MKRTLLFLILIFFWFLPLAQAEIKTFVHTVSQPFSGSQSPDDARVSATHKAKREVLEKAGTYLETLSIVEDGKLTKDQLLALASGVLKTEIISQKNYMTGEGFGIILKARVKVDTSVLEERVKKLLADRMGMEQLTASRKREKELLDKIERLEKANNRVAKKKETQAIKQIKDELKKDFQQTTKELDAVALHDQAMYLWKDGKFSNPRRVIELLNRAINMDPNYAYVYNNRGLVYANLKQYKRAIQDYGKAIELDPNYATAYSNRGSVYIDLKQHARAIQDYDKAIEVDPYFASPYYNRGLVYAKLKQYKRAIQDYNKAIQLNPYLATAYNDRGLVYDNLKQYARAILDFDKATQLDPSDARAYNNRGLAYVDLKQYAKAIQDYDKATQLDPSNALPYHNRGLMYYKLKQYKRAIQDYGKATQLDPNYATAYYNRGIAYYNLKQYAKAIQDYDKAIELNLGYADAYSNRGVAYMLLQRDARGCADLKKACELGACKGWKFATKRRLCD